MPEKRESASPSKDAASSNHSFYHALWSQTRMAQPESFNTWPLISSLLPCSPLRLEVGPGLRPRLPIAGSHFVDIAAPVVDSLNALGAHALQGELGALPYLDRTFDLVCAFDIVEHVEDDRRALSELSRVLKDDGVLIISVPVHRQFWTEFDDMVGHVRRYEPADLGELLTQGGLTLEQSARYGMQPNSPALLRLGIWFLTHQRRVALFWYNVLLLPLGILFQKRLKFEPGMIDTFGVAEIVMICRHKLGK
jgi:SAM-dependent methyltransferase